MKDKELIAQMEALEDVLEWLEEKEKVDIKKAATSVCVEECELEEWLRSPKLEKVRAWLKS